MLQEVGGRLRSVVRRADSVARLGGDEFAILVDGEPADAALEIADRLLAELVEAGRRSGPNCDRPLERIDRHRLRFARRTASSRCCVTPTSPCTRRRTTASRGGRCTDPACASRCSSGSSCVPTSTHALERDEFFLHYQPIIEVDDRRGEGDRGTRSLAAPDQGTHRSGTLHRPRRGDRTDRADRALDPARSVRPGTEPRPAAGRSAHRRQRQRRAAPLAGPRRRRDAMHCWRPGWRRIACCSS